MIKKLLTLFALVCGTQSFGQLTASFLAGDSTFTVQYIVAYPKYTAAGYYFAIDYGQPSAEQFTRFIGRRLKDGDSSLLLKSNANVAIPFNSLGHFLNYMYGNRWELLSVQSPVSFTEISEPGAIKTTSTISSDVNFSSLIFKRRKEQ